MAPSGLPLLGAPNENVTPAAPSRGRLDVFRKPNTPDPFVNAPLVSLGRNGEGPERFWISCYNGEVGSTSFLLEEGGKHRAYRWPEPGPIKSIYAVAREDADTVWCTGGGSEVLIRLQLSSGAYETYPRDAGRFVTSGMVLDPESGKLFCGAQTALFSFDTKARKTVRIYGPEEKPPDNFQYDWWRNSDGTYGTLMVTPGLSYLRWNPKDESIWWRRISEDVTESIAGGFFRLRCQQGDRIYLPRMGWLNGLTGEIVPHERPPSREACWFGRRGPLVYGAGFDRLRFSSTILRWDTRTDSIEEMFSASDTSPTNCAVSENAKILAVDIYGELKRFDADTGLLDLTRRLKSENPHRCNVIIPIDDTRITGAPFISQNFWIYDTEKREGIYGGRAAGSGGQVDYAVKAKGRIYFAAYVGGQLTEYDPEQPPGFPRNPRHVAQNRQGNHGAGITTDGSVVWAAFRPAYGTLDGAMIRYDADTGEATYRVGAQESQHIADPIFDATTNRIVAGTCRLSDCDTAKPKSDQAYAVILDPLSMDVLQKAPAPSGTDAVRNDGPLGNSRWLMSAGGRWMVFDAGEMSLEPLGGDVPPVTNAVQYTGEPGRFLIRSGNRLFLWNALDGTRHAIMEIKPGFVTRWWVHGGDITFDCGTHAAVWRNAF